MKYFAIINPGGITNFGERAIMLGTVLDLMHKHPECTIRIFGYLDLKNQDGPLYDQLTDLGVGFFPHIINARGIQRIPRILGMAIAPRLFWPRQSYNYINKSTVISKGQETLTESYGLRHFIDSILEQLLVSRFNSDVVLYGQSIGPISKWAPIARIILNRFHKIHVRDSISFDLVVNELSIPSRKVKRINDLAFKAAEWYRSQNTKPKPSHIVIVPNAAIIRSDSEVQDYLLKVSGILEKHNPHRSPVIITSSVTAGSWNNDYTLCDLIQPKIMGSRVVKLKTLEELLRLIDSAESVISARLHPLILAIGLGTPIAPVADSPKIRGILRDSSSRIQSKNPNLA